MQNTATNNTVIRNTTTQNPTTKKALTNGMKEDAVLTPHFIAAFQKLFGNTMEKK